MNSVNFPTSPHVSFAGATESVGDALSHLLPEGPSFTAGLLFGAALMVIPVAVVVKKALTPSSPKKVTELVVNKEKQTSPDRTSPPAEDSVEVELLRQDLHIARLEVKRKQKAFEARGVEIANLNAELLSMEVSLHAYKKSEAEERHRRQETTALYNETAAELSDEHNTNAALREELAIAKQSLADLKQRKSYRKELQAEELWSRQLEEESNLIISRLTARIHQLEARLSEYAVYLRFAKSAIEELQVSTKT